MGLIFNREKKPAAPNLVTETPVETPGTVEETAAAPNSVTETPVKTAAMPNSATETPQSQTAGSRIAGMLGEDPAVTAARREAQRRGAEKKAAWLSVFDGLRYLGQAAGIRGTAAPAATYNNTADIYMQKEKERQTAQTQAETAQRAYQKQLYDMAVQRYKEQRDEAERKEKKALRDKDEERKARTAELREEDARRKAEAHEVAMEGKKTENAIKEKKKENLENNKTEQGGDPNRRGSGGSGKQTQGERNAEIKREWENLPDSAKTMAKDRDGKDIYPSVHQMEAQINAHKHKTGGSAGGGKKPKPGYKPQGKPKPGYKK